MPYPEWAAGQRVTAGLLTAMQPLYVRKGVDQALSSSTTLQPDDALLLPVEADATYELDAIIYYSTRSDTDFKMQWTLPSGGFMEWTAQGLLTAATGFSGEVYFGRLTLGTVMNLGGEGANNTTQMSATVKGTVNTTSAAGDMQLTWAQNTSNATATFVRAPSFMVLKRLN